MNPTQLCVNLIVGSSTSPKVNLNHQHMSRNRGLAASIPVPDERTFSKSLVTGIASRSVGAGDVGPLEGGRGIWNRN